MIQKLKLFTILFVFFAAFCNHTFSQDNRYRIGISAQPAFSWLNSESKNIESDGLRFSSGFGLNLDIFFAENYAFTTGFFIQNLGGSLNYLNTVPFAHEDTIEVMTGAEFKYRNQYIDIPLGLMLQTNEIGYMTFFAKAGFNLMANINTKGDIKNSYRNIEKVNVSDEVNFLNLGYHVGIGAEYSLNNNNAVTFGMFYTNGFLDVTTDDAVYESFSRENEKTVQHSIKLEIGFIF